MYFQLHLRLDTMCIFLHRGLIVHHSLLVVRSATKHTFFK